MSVAYNKFYCAAANILGGTDVLKSDTLKIYLSNTAPAQSNTVYNTPAEITAQNGYTQYGNTCSFTSCNQSSGTAKLILASPSTWTASGGSFGPFEYCVLFDYTSTNKDLIGWWDYGSAITCNTGDTFAITLDGTNGVLQLA